MVQNYTNTIKRHVEIFHEKQPKLLISISYDAAGQALANVNAVINA